MSYCCNGHIMLALFVCVALCSYADSSTVVNTPSEGQSSDDRYDALARELETLKLKEKIAEKQRSEDGERLRRLEGLVMAQHQTVVQQNERIVALKTTVEKLDNNQSKMTKRLLLDSGIEGGVAFSVYLDHDLDGAGNKQPIVFNQPLYNEGVHYSNVTGIFTCPMDGVYLFIYFIGNRHAREVDAELVVNGVKQNEAVAEGLATAHDTQGGNAAIVRLVQGDTVWVDTTLGSHVEGQWRFSSFSGALLYPA